MLAPSHVYGEKPSQPKPVLQHRFLTTCSLLSRQSSQQLRSRASKRALLLGFTAGLHIPECEVQQQATFCLRQC